MTEQEIIDYIKTHECGDYNCSLSDSKIDDYGYYGDSEECKDCMYYTIIKALEKQIPKKPIDFKKVKFNGCLNNNFITGICPSCGEYVNSDDNMNSCDRKNCNQMLDWSEKDD